MNTGEPRLKALPERKKTRDKATPIDETTDKMTGMERVLDAQIVEGEIGLVIDYVPGKALAVDVLQAAMGMIHALDKLDAALLSSVDTSLEPVSVLNDVQHGSLKMLLVRALRNATDESVRNLDWKKWVGGLLVKGKYMLLQKLDADAPEIQQTLMSLKPITRLHRPIWWATIPQSSRMCPMRWIKSPKPAPACQAKR